MGRAEARAAQDSAGPRVGALAETPRGRESAPRTRGWITFIALYKLHCYGSVPLGSKQRSSRCCGACRSLARIPCPGPILLAARLPNIRRDASTPGKTRDGHSVADRIMPDQRFHPD